MQRAASYDPLDVLRLLIEQGGLLRDRDLVAHASFHRPNDELECLEVVRYLLDHGCPIDTYFGENTFEAENECMYMVVGRQTALHFAMEQGMTNLVKFLVDRRADRNLPAWSATKTKRRTVTPIELARMHGYEDVVDLLRSQDKSVDMPKTYQADDQLSCALKGAAERRSLRHKSVKNWIPTYGKKSQQASSRGP